MIKKIIEIGIGSIVGVLISVLASPILTRIVDPTDLGKLTVINNYIGVISSISFLGLNDVLSRFYFENEEINEEGALLRFCLFIPIIISFICLFILGILNNRQLLDLMLTKKQFLLTCLIVVLTIWNKDILILLQNTLNSKMYSFVTVVQKIIYLSITIILMMIINKNHLFILLLGTLLSLLIPNIIGHFCTKETWKKGKGLFPSNIKTLVSYSIPTFVYVSLYSVYEVLESSLISFYSGEYDVGIYTSISSLVGALVIFQAAFATIWQPQQTKNYTIDDDRSFFTKGNLYITVIMFFVGINMIFFKDIICLVLGEKYREGVELLPLLIFNPIINTIIVTVTSGIEKRNMNYLRIAIVIISIVISIVLSSLLFPSFGNKGIIVSSELSLLSQYLLTTLISKKLYDVDYSLGKFMLFIVPLIIYSYINTYYSFCMYTIISYIFILAIYICIYKEAIVEIHEIVKSYLSAKKHNVI